MEMDDLLIQRSIGCKITRRLATKTFIVHTTQDTFKNLLKLREGIWKRFLVCAQMSNIYFLWINLHKTLGRYIYVLVKVNGKSKANGVFLT